MAEPATLYATQAAPIPAGAVAAWFSGVGGVRLRAALFPAPDAPRGTVVVSPGRTEPIEKYFETVETLNARGFAAIVHDWRGQGLSHRLLPDRRLGHARGWKDFLGDYAALLAAFEAQAPRPWIALGHSMGGCLTLLALAGGQSGFSAAILSAPMLGVATGKVPLGVARTYLLYATLAEIQGGRFEGVPYTGDWRLPTPWPRPAAHLTLVANPNSPTGTRVDNGALEALAQELRGPLVVDERAPGGAGRRLRGYRHQPALRLQGQP